MTEKLEAELRELTEIETISSTSRNGVAVLAVEIDERIKGKDADAIRTKSRALADVASSLAQQAQAGPGPQAEPGPTAGAPPPPGAASAGDDDVVDAEFEDVSDVGLEDFSAMFLKTADRFATDDDGRFLFVSPIGDGGFGRT